MGEGRTVIDLGRPRAANRGNPQRVRAKSDAPMCMTPGISPCWRRRTTALVSARASRTTSETRSRRRGRPCGTRSSALSSDASRGGDAPEGTTTRRKRQDRSGHTPQLRSPVLAGEPYEPHSRTPSRTWDDYSQRPSRLGIPILRYGLRSFGRETMAESTLSWTREGGPRRTRSSGWTASR